LIYASGIIRDEQEEQTITYLLIRRISKWAIYLVKLLATMTTTVALTATFTVLTYAAIFAGTGDSPAIVAQRCFRAAAIHSLAIVAYCSLFGLMGLLMKRILIAGIVYTAIVEGLLANLPFGIRLLTVIYYTRVIAFRSLDFVILGRGQNNIAAEVWQIDLRTDPNLIAHPSVGTCVVILIVASLAFVMLAAWLCARREFHVKTPENE
jgi:ABC-2 type transport system permease protein